MALNQLQTKPESDLAAVSSIDEIAHIRIITKAGGSRKATPTQAANLLAPLLAPQLAPLLGIDYSKLEEQIIPGEFWLAPDGSRKQVYVRTFAGTLAVTEGFNRVSLIPGVTHTPIDMFGYVTVGGWNDPTTVPSKLINAMCWGAYGLALEFDPSLLGKQYYVTAKYIKR